MLNLFQHLLANPVSTIKLPKASGQQAQHAMLKQLQHDAQKCTSSVTLVSCKKLPLPSILINQNYTYARL
jgi:hypothetical protein